MQVLFDYVCDCVVNYTYAIAPHRRRRGLCFWPRLIPNECFVLLSSVYIRGMLLNKIVWRGQFVRGAQQQLNTMNIIQITEHIMTIRYNSK